MLRKMLGKMHWGGGGPTQLVPITPWNFRSALALIGNKRFFPFGSFLMVLIAVC